MHQQPAIKLAVLSNLDDSRNAQTDIMHLPGIVHEVSVSPVDRYLDGTCLVTALILDILVKW